MALIITPGPLAADGTRITAEGDISDFISNTDVRNIGRAEATAGALLDFVTSATDPPALADRSRSTLWFERGNGRLQKWTLNPTGPTGGRWLAVSERKEALFHVTGDGPAPKNHLAWLSTSDDPSEPNPVVLGRFGLRTISLAATAVGSASSRALLIGPFRVVSDEDAAVGDFAVGVEVGFTQLAVTSTDSPLSMLGKNTTEVGAQGNPTQNNYDWDAGYTGLGYITQSGPKNTGQVVDVFFFGDPSHFTG